MINAKSAIIYFGRRSTPPDCARWQLLVQLDYRSTREPLDCDERRGARSTTLARADRRVHAEASRRLCAVYRRNRRRKRRSQRWPAARFIQSLLRSNCNDVELGRPVGSVYTPFANLPELEIKSPIAFVSFSLCVLSCIHRCEQRQICWTVRYAFTRRKPIRRRWAATRHACSI